MEEVKETISFDKIDMSNNSIFIEEHHDSDANFILNSIISHCIDKKYSICFVLFHNTFSHFHNIGMKLGYNLMKLHGSSIRVIEPLNIICQSIENEDNNLLAFNTKNGRTNFIKKIVKIIKDECISIKKNMSSKNVYLIVDDISHLFNIGLNVQDVWLFNRYIRSLSNTELLFTVCVGSHYYKDIENVCDSNIIAHGLRYFAELVLSTQPLKTGHSESVSGKIIIQWQSENIRLKIKSPEEIIFFFKLFDHQVKLHPPGNLYTK